MSFRKRKPPVAASPGTFTVNAQAPSPRIHVVRYTAETLEEEDIADVNRLRKVLSEKDVAWIDVQGLGDQKVLERLAEIFPLHRLAIADVVNVPQRPKCEPYDQQLFLVTRAVTTPDGHDLHTEQVSMFLGPNYLLTFQESYSGLLEPLRARLRSGKGLIRHEGAGYLTYAVLDAVIDGYYPVLECIGDYLAALEDEALDRPSKAALRKNNRVRNDLLLLRRILWPQREALTALIRDPNPLLADTVRLYLRDCQDHCLQLSEVIESYREVVGSITNTYLSSVSNRMNEVMKVLTIMASIFIPLTFMAGIYGMNFEHMPELHMRYGYPVFWFTMVVVAAGLVIYFRRRGWLGSGSKGKDK